jgi:hypothetical protein
VPHANISRSSAVVASRIRSGTTRSIR